ncbi:hypothetical protein CYK37_30105 [Mesorhizobium loti]|nr:hypothetical protein [Mesorhizobium loti]PLP55546.1 hypothetical protein CYK37_30105 [Mesorhizobium loti]
MAKVSGSIPNLANGVSQQAMALRLASQGDLQVNAYSTVVDGLRKRPPTQRRAMLSSTLGSAVHTHMINRDATERYEVLMSPYGIKVFDLQGNEKVVNTPDGFSYLQYPGSPAKPPYRSFTVGDYTFITNTTKAAQLDPSVIEPLSPSEAIIHVMAGNYGKDYKIIINGSVVGWYRTPDGTSAAQSPAVDTNFIARRLATGETVALETTVNGKPNGDWIWKPTDTNLNAKGITAANGWTVKVTKGTIYIRRNDGASFSIAVEDGYNGHAMKAIQQTVQDFSDLPSYCEDTMAVQVTGSVSTEFDDYFVRFSTPASGSSPGVWKEIPKPGIVKGLNAATMPHVLVREANGSFTFKKAAWDQRKAGDDKTSPEPSFVGQTINDIVFFKNRLGFLSGENVILSRAGSFFDFWRATATSLLDDDPIDVAAGETGVSVLRSAVGYSDRLVLFADQVQFSLMGNELLTPKTASIRSTTSYATSNKARPVTVGDAIFFPVDRGQFSMVREYRIDRSTGDARAEDITGHVPQYIPGSIIKMAASTHEDILVVQSDGEPQALWVYKYYWANDQKLLASWSKWTFPGVTNILDFGFISSQLILVLQRGAETVLEAMDVEPGGVDPYSTFITHLDRRFEVVNPAGMEYNPYEDQTYFPMPFDITRQPHMCVTAGTSGTPKMNVGLHITPLETEPTHVILKGDFRDVPLYFGIPYEMRYRLSTIFIRQESKSGGVTVISEGRLQLIQLMFLYSKTAFFRVEVSPLAGPMRPYVTNGRMLGDPENRVDRVHLSDGVTRVPILMKNDRVKVDIVNDSYLPCSLLSVEWLGNYVPKSRRI